jgi:hypothetical protein
MVGTEGQTGGRPTEQGGVRLGKLLRECCTRTTATRYSSRYTEQSSGQQYPRKLLKDLVNRGGLEPPTR